jgi:Flp pilus assembly protein TadD
MGRIDSRRKLTRRALLALLLWLVAVVGLVLWRRPEFWIQPHERFRQAQRLASEERWAESLTSIGRALENEPANTGYLIFKGYRQLDLKDAAAAERTFNHALQTDPSNPEARLGLATALAQRGKRAAAMAILEPLSTETANASQIRRRAQLYAQLGARQSALDDISALLHTQPQDPDLLKEAAELALLLEDWPRAASLLQRLGSVTSDSRTRQWAADNRAIALQASAHRANELRHHADAAAIYTLLAHENPGEPAFRRARAHALNAAGRTREAELAFRELLADGAADVSIRQAYAWLLNTQRRYAEAWRVIEPLPRPARDLELLELQARTAIWAEQPSEALHLIRALLDHRPHDPELWRHLADTWHKLGDDRQTAEALAVYVRLQSQDWRARERLAGILARLGSLDEAIQEYRKLHAADPGNRDFLRSLGLLQETAGHLEAAADSYRQAIENELTPPPDQLLRLARVHRWMGRPEHAVAWYERYLQSVPEAVLRRAAEAELALSLLDAGNPAASSARLQAIASQSPLDAGELMIAARAATATSQPAAATKYLEMLAERRPLSTAEQVWLAGQYRAAGQSDRALAVYERLASSSAEIDSEVLEAVGDLRYDAGDYAAALRAFQQVEPSRDVTLKIARAAARAGQLSIAADTYERHVRAHPDDLQARLEAARYQASAGRAERAIVHYQVFVAARGGGDLRLELARVHLAAEQFAAAEQWARQALAAGESPDEARLALAQALHLQGRPREARIVLAELLRATPADSRSYAWQGQVAVALDRHLDAFRSFDRAIALGAEPKGTLFILRGTAAQKRGDYARALQSYRAAAEEGASPAQVDAARRSLYSATVPSVYMPLWTHSDTNDLRLVQLGGGVVLFPPSLAGALSLEGSVGTVSQRNFSSRINTIALTLDRMFPIPDFSLALGIALSQYDRGTQQVAWQANGMYYFANDTVIAMEFAREPLLPLRADQELRQFNRVLDLRATGPDAHIKALRGLLDLVARENRRVRVETGLEKLHDGNRRAFSYVHYQIPVQTDTRRWTAIRPNVFFETFRENPSAYYSPQQHFTLGTMLHAIRRYGRWNLESEVNPQLLHTDGATGFGGHALMNIGARLGGASLAGGAFIFWDGLEHHLQWRLGGRVSIPLAR